MRDYWTVERIELLCRLWAEGATAAAIGVRLGGVSRSAVLGKVFRLRPVTAGASVSAPAEQDPAANAASMQITAPARRRRSRKRDKRPPSAPAVRTQHKTLLDLTNNTCRWPHGRPGTEKFFFCGKPEADLERGIPYCARHMRRAYPACVGPEESGAPVDPCTSRADAAL